MARNDDDLPVGIGRNSLTSPAEPSQDFDDSDPAGIEDAQQYLADAAAADTHSSDVEPMVEEWFK